VPAADGRPDWPCRNQDRRQLRHAGRRISGNESSWAELARRADLERRALCRGRRQLIQKGAGSRRERATARNGPVLGVPDGALDRSVRPSMEPRDPCRGRTRGRDGNSDEGIRRQAEGNGAGLSVIARSKSDEETKEVHWIASA